MHPVFDLDPLLLLAIALAAKRKPADLAGIVAALNLVQEAGGKFPPAGKLVEAMQRLSVHGLIDEAGGAYALSAEAQKIVAGLPRKGEAALRVFSCKDQLAHYNARERRAPVPVDEAQLTAAIAAHKSLLGDGKRSLMVPPPPPPEDSGRGPGFRKRKPLPARKRRV